MRTEPAFLISALRHFLDPDAPEPEPSKIEWTELLRLTWTIPVAVAQ